MYPNILDIANITDKPDNVQDLQFTTVNHTDNKPIDFFSIKSTTIFSAVMLFGWCIVILSVILKDSYVQYYQNKALGTNNLVEPVNSNIQVNTRDPSALEAPNSLTPLLNQNEDHKHYNSNLAIVGEFTETTYAESPI